MPGRLYADGAGPALASSDLTLTGFGLAADITLVVSGNDQRGTITVASAGRDEVQTLTVSAGTASSATFDLTFNAQESSVAVAVPAGGISAITVAQVQATIDSISGFTAGTDAPVVSGPTGGPFVITFSNPSHDLTDVGAITMTSKTGTPTPANGSIAETIVGTSLAAKASIAVAFKRPFAHAPFVVLGKYGVADTEKFAVTAASTTGFTAAVNGTPSAATVYGFTYFVLG